MNLNMNQKRAVEYLDGPLLVLAGPGTGKTQLLSEKVAHILKATDTNPENILCLTFTDSGAMNMKERLKSIIGPEGAKVNVSTYHVFGTNILAQYKNYSESYDRKLDSAIDEVTQFKIIQELQDKLSGTDILRGDNIKLIINAISSAKSAGLSADNLKKIAKTNQEDSRILSEAISPLLKNVVPRKFKESYEQAYQPIFEILKNYENASPILPTVERSIGELARTLKVAMLEAESAQSIAPLTEWRNDHFELDKHSNYRLKDRVANKKLASLANLMSSYNDYLSENALYDFDDMIQEAVKVLSEDEGFRLTMSERFEYILLDEFQDTNPSQFMIIKKLTEYEKPSIMAVGDDDQAIYEFQGALSTNLTDFQKHYNAEVIPLVENYRSTQEILDFSHEIIKQAPDRFADKTLTAHKKVPKQSQIYRYEFRSSDMEFGFIADKIAELINSGVPQNEIAVISYMRKYFTPLLPYLKSHPEINIAYEKQNDLLEDDKIHQILTIAKFVYELGNERKEDTSAVEVLGYPFFKLPMLEVIKIVGKAKKDKKAIFDYLADSDVPEIRGVAEFLANLAAISFTEPLDIVFDYIIGASELKSYRSPFLEYYTNIDDYTTYTLYENLASLRGKLRKHFGERSLKLSDLIEMIKDYENAKMSLNTTSPYRDAENAVQVLTAHKAKGLEFEYIFIISADHAGWGKEKGNNTTLTLPRNLKQIQHSGTTDSEKLRILYVALTRAKQGIFITNSLTDFNGKNPERLEYLHEYEKDGKIYSPFLPNSEVICVYNQVSKEITENNLKNWLKSYIITSPEMKAIYKESIKNYRMSATSLKTFIDLTYAGPVEFFKRVILHVPSEPEDESLAFGTLVHRTFEEVTNKGISDEEAVKFFLDELEKRELKSSIKQSLRERGPIDLAVSLKEFGDILRNGKAEVNIGSEKITIEGVPVTGSIDHVVIDETNKTIEIYDFKTSGYNKGKWQSYPTLFKYCLQLEFYKLLLNYSPTYRKYKVTRAHILFVKPEQKDGQVFDKIYEFDEEFEKDILSLMKVVYKIVSTLEFIDDPEVFIPPDQSKGLKQIKEFIALLLAKNNKK